MKERGPIFYDAERVRWRRTRRRGAYRVEGRPAGEVDDVDGRAESGRVGGDPARRGRLGLRGPGLDEVFDPAPTVA